MQDFGLEYPALRPRLLIGAAAWKHQIDAFLYYGITEWEKGGAVKTNTWNDGYDLTFTDDLRANGFMNAQEAIDMEGQLALPGPANSRYGGILSTLQLQGVRDGLEDYEMYKLLDRLVKSCAELGLTVDAEEYGALEVPDVLFKGWPNVDALGGGTSPQRFFAEDPYVLRAQWGRGASAIETLQAKLARARRGGP